MKRSFHSWSNLVDLLTYFAHYPLIQTPEILRGSIEMTTIIASYTVIPSETTPKRRLSMSESDDIVRWAHTPIIYIYKGNHNTKKIMIKSLSDSLSKILVHYYPLAGRLNWIEGGRVELECNAKGALLLEAESTKTLAEFGDFSPNEPIDELIPIVDYTQPLKEIPLLLVQLTRFQGGKEGLTIGVSISHPLIELFKSQYPPSSPLFDHQEFNTPPLILGKSDAVGEKNKETAVALLRLTSEQVEKLKKKTNDHSLKEGFRSYSRFEVIVAHIWRTLCMARQLEDQQQSVVRIMVDIRRRLDPPLPSNYFGNAVFPTITPKCHTRDIISNPINYAAHMIREGIDRLTNEYIRSQINFIRGQEKIDSLRTVGNLNDERSKNAPFYGNPNIFAVSWMSMLWYKADFGWGKPVYFGPGSIAFDGKAYIIQSSQEDGSIIILLRLQTAHMQIFNKLFYKDIRSSLM
ncbi:hypothetical protein VNO77_33964 [Canavalia gladiata]|uniref:Uncharacterized protein n=1 Tax=Canavalia gladiata TaxID=3824 RepID=A0AAN9KFR1_CANGL